MPQPRAFLSCGSAKKDLAAKCDQPRIAAVVLSAKSIAAVVTLAKSDRRIAATTAQWDADPWLLNTLGGVVDRRSGEIRRHRPEDYLTKITSVAPDRQCSTETWSKFLKRITNEDDNLISFLQRMADSH